MQADFMAKMFGKQDEDEDKNKENAAPYDSIASRDPISDPRGKNPALEESGDGFDPDNDPDSLRDLNLQMSDLGKYYAQQGDGRAPSTPPARQAMMDAMRAKNSMGVKKIAGTMSSDDQGDDNGPAAQIVSPSSDIVPPMGERNPGFVPAMQAQMATPPPVDPSAPPMPPAPQGAPMPPQGMLPQPPQMGSMPPPPPSAGMVSNLPGNLYLAGVQGAFGANKATGQNDLGNALNQQSAQMNNRLQNDADVRSRVMQAIMQQKNAQTFASGQNDLSRQNTKDIATMKVNKAPMAGRPLDPGRQANFDAHMGLQKTKLGNLQEQQANNDTAKATSGYVTMLDLSNKAQHVLDKVKAGVLTSSQNVHSSLANDISSLLGNGKASAVSDREHAQINSLEGSWNKIASFAQSKPRDTIPQPYLDQLEQELNILKASTIQSYRNKTNELKSGTQNPQKQNVFQNRFDSQVNAQAPIPSDNPTSPETVNVIDPDGIAGTIPKSQLDDAVKNGGYKLDDSP